MATDVARSVMLCMCLGFCVPAGARAQTPVVVPAPTAPEEPNAPERYGTAGIAFGSPGFANVSAGYYASRLALRATGGFGGEGRAGLQADLGWRAIRAGQLSLGVALVAGTLKTRDPAEDDGAGGAVPRRRPYTGAVLDLGVDGWRVQLGLAHQFRNTSRAAQLLAQVGYEYSLWPRAQRQGDR